MGYHADCKAKGIRLQLSPVKGRDLWKHFDSKRNPNLLYFAGADTRRGYDEALREFGATREAELPRYAQEALGRRRHALAVARSNGTTQAAVAVLEADVATRERHSPEEAARAGSFIVAGLDEINVNAVWEERAEGRKKSALPTIGTVAENFLATRTKGRSDKTIRSNRQRLNKFVNVYGKKSVESINGVLVTEYFNSLSASGLEQKTLDHYWQAFEALVDHIEATFETFVKPRAFLKLKFEPHLTENADGENEAKANFRPEDLWTADDFKAAAEMGEWWELITLLALNCGFTGTDLDKVTGDRNNNCKTGIDWANGRIIHRRNKTKRFKNPPIVNYKLWPRTLELLKKFAKREGIALSMPDGGRLQTKTNDMLSRAWKRDRTFEKQLRFIRHTTQNAVDKITSGLGQAYICDKTGLTF